VIKSCLSQNYFIDLCSCYDVLHCTHKYCNKICVFLKICYCKSFQDHVLSDGEVTSTSQVCMSAMLLLMIIGN
jgi:hypothetical protein